MKPGVKIVLFALLLAALFASCRHTARVAHSRTDRSAAQQTISDNYSDSIPEPPDTVEYDCLTANFECLYDGVTVNGQVRLKRDSVLWLSASKFVELGRALFTEDSVFVYAKVMNRYFSGTYSDLEAATGIITDFFTLQSIFIGESELVRRTWFWAEFSDWREMIYVADDGSMVKNRNYPYKMRIAIRSRLFSGRAEVSYTKVRWVESTSFPFSVSPLAKRYVQ